jgi:hypothetical protein
MTHIYSDKYDTYNGSAFVTTVERKLAEAQLFVLTSPKIGARRQLELAVLQ